MCVFSHGRSQAHGPPVPTHTRARVLLHLSSAPLPHQQSLLQIPQLLAQKARYLLTAFSGMGWGWEFSFRSEWESRGSRFHFLLELPSTFLERNPDSAFLDCSLDGKRQCYLNNLFFVSARKESHSSQACPSIQLQTRKPLESQWVLDLSLIC